MYRALVFPHTMYLGTSDVKGRRTLLHLTYPGTPTFAFDLGTSMYLARSYPGTRTLERKLAKKGPKYLGSRSTTHESNE